MPGVLRPHDLRPEKCHMPVKVMDFDLSKAVWLLLPNADKEGYFWHPWNGHFLTYHLRMSAVKSSIKRHLLLPLSLLGHWRKRPARKVRLLGTKETDTFLNQWSLKPNPDCPEGYSLASNHGACSLDSNHGAGLATNVSFPERYWMLQPFVL